jgi:glutaredoxin
MTTSNDQQSDVIVAGADWCGDTRATLAYLQELGVPFDYLNVDEDQRAADWVREQNGGKLKLPTVDVGGLVLSIPDAEQLQAALEDRNLLGD